MTTPRLDIPNLDDLIERYIAGESLNKLAKEAGVNHGTIKGRVEERGIPIRPRGSYPAHTAAAHAARRGATDSDAVKHQRAVTRQRLGLGVSANEDNLAGWFDERGIEYVRQQAVGPYNIDFALAVVPVAVEVSGGGHNPRVNARRKERIEYLLNEGWAVIEIIVRDFKPKAANGWSKGRAHPLTADAADYIVAALEELRSNPAAPCQHRMIWADGQLYAATSRKVA